MKQIFISLLLVTILNVARAQDSTACSNGPSWFKPVCQRLHQIWTQGDNELYISGYAWHNRYTYTSEKIKTYNELAWGGGLGKGLYDKEGDWHGLYAFAFLDSHKNIEPVVGYSFLKVAHLGEHARLGIGYAILVTARPDLYKGIPFPGVLPWGSIGYRHLSLSATYIPGSKNVGNVLFIVAKWTF